MLPDPLHPAVVHLPIALAVLLPIFTLGGALAIRRGVLPVRAWSGVVVLATALVLSSWAALETGEEEEDRVERVVAERFIEAHEEAAEQFMIVAVALLVTTLAGHVAGTAGSAARIASVVLALVLLGAGVRVGERGGALVYEHGAANAYTRSHETASDARARGEGPPSRRAERERDRD